MNFDTESLVLYRLNPEHTLRGAALIRMLVEKAVDFDGLSVMSPGFTAKGGGGT